MDRTQFVAEKTTYSNIEKRIVDTAEYKKALLALLEFKIGLVDTFTEVKALHVKAEDIFEKLDIGSKDRVIKRAYSEIDSSILYRRVTPLIVDEKLHYRDAINGYLAVAAYHFIEYIYELIHGKRVPV